MLRCLPLAYLLPTASLGAGCQDDSACLAKDTALLQRTGTREELTKLANLKQADLLTSDALGVQELEGLGGKTADASDPPLGEYTFCMAKGPARKRFHGNFTWDEKMHDGKCDSLCKKNLSACEEGGSLAASCGCINVAEDAKKACEGKFSGHVCIFKSPVFSKTIESHDKTIDSTQIEYNTICQDRMGTLSCMPLRAKWCHKTQYDHTTKKRTTVWAKVGSRCIHGSGSESQSAGSNRMSILKRSTLSYCVNKNDAEVGKPNAKMKCLSGYNPSVHREHRE